MSVDEDCASMYMNFCEFCAITGSCPLFRRANELLDEENSEIPDVIGSCPRVQACIDILGVH
jgi:hypothetical protein